MFGYYVRADFLSDLHGTPWNFPGISIKDFVDCPCVNEVYDSVSVVIFQQYINASVMHIETNFI